MILGAEWRKVILKIGVFAQALSHESQFCVKKKWLPFFFLASNAVLILQRQWVYDSSTVHKTVES